MAGDFACEPAASAAFDVEGPLDLPATVGGVVDAAGAVVVVTRTPQGVGSARLRLDGRRLLVDAWGEGAAWLLGRVPRLVGLHDRPWEFQPDHPRLSAWARASPGLRMTSGANPVEVAMHAVFGQRVTTTDARASWRMFLARYGEQVPSGVGGPVPPSPATVAAMSRDDLLAVGLDLSRSRTLVALAREASRIAAHGDDAEAVSRRLLALPGIGPWTVGLVRHYAFGDASAVPLGDWHIGRDVVFALTGETHGDDRRMMDLLDAYPGNQGRAWRLIMASGVGHPKRAPGRRPNPVFGPGRRAG